MSINHFNVDYFRAVLENTISCEPKFRSLACCLKNCTANASQNAHKAFYLV